MWTISQNGDRWELTNAAGDVVASETRYEDALAVLAAQLAPQQTLAMDAGGDDGLLPETWVSPVAFVSEVIGERDFSETEWVWRDPAESLLPLMLHTQTDTGHFGAELAGFITEIAESDGTGSMGGRFYDTDQGRAARDLLLAGRRYGVSVDPGERTEVEERCDQLSEDGWCESFTLAFIRYDVIGLTMTPFPGFASAHIMLGAVPAGEASGEAPAGNADSEAPFVEDEVADGAQAAAAAPCCDACAARDAAASSAAQGARAVARLRPVVASGYPLAAPRSWFDDPGFDRLTAPRYEADGRVYGHLAPWGQCHTGSGQGECVVTPRSLSGYANFLTGYHVCEDGSEVRVGQLSVGGGHADRRLSYRGAIEHYDNVAAAFADVAVGEDAYGIWFAGALQPGVTDEQLRTVRACPPSGDWRPIGTGLELVAACSVVSQGFPVARVASSGRVLSLVAAGQAVIARLSDDPSEERIARLERQLAEVRTLATADARGRLAAAGRARARERLLAHT